MSSYYGSSGSRRGDEWTWTSWSQSTSWHHSGGWNGSGGSQAAMAHSSNKDGWWWGDSQGWSNGAQSWCSGGQQDPCECTGGNTKGGRP
ncbi:unnamed protein product [Symbiodinium necroappetens]|uniref:Uncharacterized protein n=1 Tax=Symbiodinium necroappetens TaxID=1628268 RepID=A0A812NB52_9DINO|nr:unnamed protein product [Symbiodinium necroappetens]